MNRTATLQEINNWRSTGNYPEWASTFKKRDRYFSYKRNPNVKPILYLKDLHHHAKDFCAFIKKVLPNESIYLTGSWVNGTFCHPDSTPEYCEVRKDIGKQEISDFDLFLPKLTLQEARELMWEIGKKYEIKVDAVHWWCSGINIKTGEIRACNVENKLGPIVKRQYRNNYTEEELEPYKELIYGMSR